MRRVLLAALLCFVSAFAAQGEESDWRAELVRDFEDVAKARSNRAALHRSLAQKWHEAERLDAALAEYAARAEADGSNAALRYGYGYALALRGGEGDLERSAGELSAAVGLDSEMLIGHFTLGGVRLRLAAAEKSDYEAAASAYNECLRIDPEFAPAHYGLGEAVRMTGEFETALEHYESALQFSNGEWARPHYGMALAYEGIGSLSAAEESARLALQIDRTDADSLFLLGQLLAKQGSSAEAEELYAEGEAAAGGVPLEERLRLARIFAERGELPYAERNYRRALESEMEAEAAGGVHFEYGETLWGLGDVEDAAAAYRRAAELDETYAGRFARSAQELYQGDPPDEAAARTALEKALAVNAEDAPALLLYGQIEAAAGNAPAAVARYEAAAGLPEGGAAHFPLGDLYYAEGRIEEAGRSYRRGAELFPDEAGRFSALADGFYAQERYAEAADAWEKHLLIDSGDMKARYFQARSYEALEETEKALALYEVLRASAPDTEDALLRLSRLYFSLERVEEGLAVLEDRAAHRPDDPEAHYMLGDALYGLGRMERAEAVLLRVTELDDAHASAHERLGFLMEKRDPEAASARYLRTVELDPARPEPYFRLSGLLLAAGDSEGAVQRLTEGLERDPERAAEQFALGGLHEKAERLEEALPRYRRAARLEPTRADWQYTFARCAHRVGESWMTKEGGDASDAPETPDISDASDTPDTPDTNGMNVEKTADSPEMGAENAEEESFESMESEADAPRERLPEWKRVLLEADAAYTAAIDLEGDYDRFYWRGRLRFAHRHLGDAVFVWSETALDFRNALDVDGARLEALYWLAMTYKEMGQEELAKDAFETLLERDAEYLGANAELGIFAKDRRDYREAMDFFRRELELNEESAVSHRWLGHLYITFIADAALGAEHLERSVALDGTNADAYYELGRAYFEIDQLRRSAAAFEGAVRLEPGHLAANYNLATVYEYLGERGLAASRLRHLLRQDNLPGEWRLEAEGILRRLEGSE